MVLNAKRVRTGLVSTFVVFLMLFGTLAAMTVSAGNSPPDIMSSPTMYAYVGMQYEYQVLAIDYEDKQLNYTLFFSPEGMQINSMTGLITWTPKEDQTGTHIVGIAVFDKQGAKDMQNYTLEVYEPPPPYVEIWTPYYGQEVTGTLGIEGYVYSGLIYDGSTQTNYTVYLSLVIYDSNKKVVWAYNMTVLTGGKEPYREANFKAKWDSTKVQDGKYILMATATDINANTGTSTVDFLVDNFHTGDIIWFTEPSDQTTVDGYQNFAGGANKAKNMTGVFMMIEDAYNNGQVIMEWTQVSGIYEWAYGYNFTGLTSCYLVTVKAMLYENALGRAQITVCTEKIPPPPPPPPPPPGEVKAWFDKPVDGATVSGTIAITFGAYFPKEAALTAFLSLSDSAGLIMGATFTGKSNGKDQVFWKFELDTTTYSDGKAYASLNITTDTGAAGWAMVNFIINNDVTPPPPPPPPPPGNVSLDFYSPKEGATVSGVITVAGRTYCEEKIRTIQITIFVDNKEYTQVFSTGGGWRDFTFELDTVKLTNDVHTITGKFMVGDMSAKASLKIVVKNSITPPPPPPPPPPPVIPGGEKNPDGSVDVEGKEVKFEAPSYSGMDNSSMNYTWEFGDGTISHEKNPTHKYDKNGNYDVKLTVTDGTTQKQSSVDLNVGKSPVYTTKVPGFGAAALVLGLIIGCVATFFRCRK